MKQTMSTFTVPTRDEVSEANQQLFDALKKGLGFTPNLFASFAHSEAALGSYLTFQNRKNTLTNREKELINLVVSQVNGCSYCQAAHSTIGKMNGFTEEETIELRKGTASFNVKYDALVKFAKATTESKGHPSQETVDAFYAAGYTNGQLVDAVFQIGEKIMANYIHNITQLAIDFPAAPVI
jgi:uncharacterized peroxidase-related enzyme